MGILLGPYKFGMTRDKEGIREYKVSWKVLDNFVTTYNDIAHLWQNTAGLPSIGSTWSQIAAVYGWNGRDDWAFCTPELEVEMFSPSQEEPPQVWSITNTFSNITSDRCQDASIENPLLEPPKISGSFVKYRELPHEDRDGKPYRSTTGEPLVGQEVERDQSRWEINFEINLLNINLALVASLADRLNSGPLWGLGPEKVKFSKFRFRRLLYGLCTFYVNASFGFDIRDDWTQYLADKGRMELEDGGDPTNPDHWRVAKDRYGENKPVLRLDTNGKPIVSESQTPKTIERQPYFTGNLLALGIPASF